VNKSARLPWIQRHQTAERGRIVFVLLAALALAVFGLADYRVSHIEHREFERDAMDAIRLAHTARGAGLSRLSPRPALHLVRGDAR